jgi:DNA-binding transcriptional regulator YdaS (Cro superfamily)
MPTDRDPLFRAEHAKAAQAEASRDYREAVRDIVAGHKGNMSKAARELGISPQRVQQIMAGMEPPAEGDGSLYEPARYFVDKYDADAALRDWALDWQELIDRRDPLVRGAHAAGMSERQIRHLTGLKPETIERLTAGDIVVAVDVPLEVWESAVERFTDLADAASHPTRAVYRNVGRALAGAIGMPINEQGRAAVLDPSLSGLQFHALTEEEKAERLMSARIDGDVPEVSPEHQLLGWDGWVALYCITLTRTAADADNPLGDAMRHSASILRHVRTHGSLPEVSS